MKTWYLLPFVMVLGVMVGRYLPKDELRTSKPSLKPVEQPAPRNDSLNSLTRMIQIPDRASRPRRASAPQPPVAVAEQDGVGGEAPEAAEESRRDRRRREWLERGEFSPEDLRARIDEAKDLWMTRVQIARAQMFDKLDLHTAEQQAFFDETINAMNASLALTLLDVADGLRAGAEPTPEMGVRAVSEMSAALLEAYEGLAAVVAPEKLGDVSKMQLTDFIDPMVIEPLIDVQDKLQNIRPRGEP